MPACKRAEHLVPSKFPKLENTPSSIKAELCAAWLAVSMTSICTWANVEAKLAGSVVQELLSWIRIWIPWLCLNVFSMYILDLPIAFRFVCHFKTCFCDCLTTTDRRKRANIWWISLEIKGTWLYTSKIVKAWIWVKKLPVLPGHLLYISSNHSSLLWSQPQCNNHRNTIYYFWWYLPDLFSGFSAKYQVISGNYSDTSRIARHKNSTVLM